MCYPDNCLRGISSASFLTDGRKVSAQIFQFQDDRARDDGWIEESINWEDDEAAIDFMLSQENEDGERQFVAGIALIPRNDIDTIIEKPNARGMLSYERRPLAHNRYHGNILLRSGIDKPRKRLIVGGLALMVADVIPQEPQ